MPASLPVLMFMAITAFPVQGFARSLRRRTDRGWQGVCAEGECRQRQSESQRQGRMSKVRVNAKGVNAKSMGELSKARVNVKECNGRVSCQWVSVSVTSVILIELDFRLCF